MKYEPFRLYDRVLPGQKNDLNVVAWLDTALHEVADKPTPSKPRSPAAVTESLKAFQRDRGLKADGIAGAGLDPDTGQDRTEGPTLLKLNADLRAKKLKGIAKHTRPPAVAMPIRSGVGPGQPNRAEDVAKANRALALMGVSAKRRALEGQPADPEDLQQSVRKFQTQHGLKSDGIMKPGGETQARLAPLVEAKVAAEIGEDMMAPKPFEPKPNPTIVRTYPDIPTRMSVPFGSGMGFDEDDTDHRLAFKVADDIMKAEGRAQREAREANSTWVTSRSRPADTRDPSGEAATEQPAEDGTPAKDKATALRERLANTDNNLTKRQIDKAVELNRLANVEVTDRQLDRLATYVTENHPDFETPLQADYDAGELDMATLEDQIERHARQASLHPDDPRAQARVVADTNVLVAAYADQARKAGIAFDESAAREAANTLIDAARGGDHRRAMNAAIGMVLELAPITGEIAAAIDLVRTYKQLQEAEEAGDADRVKELRTAVSVAALSAVPAVGRFVKGGRLIDRARRQVGKPKVENLSTSATDLQRGIEKARQYSPVRALDEQINLRRWATIIARDQKAGKPLSLAEIAKNNPILQGLTKKELASIQGSISQRIGTEAEVFIRAIMRRGGLADFKHGRQTHSLNYKYDGGSLRKYDGVVAKETETSFGGLLMYTISLPKGKATSFELKAASSDHPKKQRLTDDRLAASSKDSPNPQTEKIKVNEEKIPLPSGPELGSFKLLRLPITDIPKQQVMNALTETLSQKGHSDEVIEAVLRGVDDFYKVDRSLLKRTDVGSVLAASLITASTLSGDTEDVSDDD